MKTRHLHYQRQGSGCELSSRRIALPVRCIFNGTEGHAVDGAYILAPRQMMRTSYEPAVNQLPAMKKAVADIQTEIVPLTHFTDFSIIRAVPNKFDSGLPHHLALCEAYSEPSGMFKTGVINTHLLPVSIVWSRGIRSWRPWTRKYINGRFSRYANKSSHQEYNRSNDTLVQ